MKKLFLLLAAICCAVVMNAETYGLSVGGVQVTSDNASNILGNGTASYDASSNTLTLNNADIRMNGAGAIVAAGELYICVVGTNNYIAVNNLGEYAGAAIQTAGALTLYAPSNQSEFSKLQIVCGAAPALYTLSGNICLNHTLHVDIKGGTGANGCIKSYSGNLRIDGASLSMLPAWIRITGPISINSSEITSPADAVTSADGKIVRSGTTTEYSNQQQVVISSLLRKLIYGVMPKNSGNKVQLNEYIRTESNTFRWVEIGEQYTLTAMPASGYNFVGWFDQNDQPVSTNNPLNFFMTASTDLIYGKFEQTGPNNKCGDNLTWEYNESNKTLTITGSGEMYNYEHQGDGIYNYPWWDIRKDIQHIVIEGATSIGTTAFLGCENVSSISLPSTLKSIEFGAFAYLDETLKSISFPEGLLSIGQRAFIQCEGLTALDLPSTLKSLGEGAFLFCTGVQSVTCRAKKTPVLEETVFSNYAIPLYVPAESVDLYKAADQWKDFDPILPINSQGIESVQPSEVRAQKVIKNGQLLIEKNGKVYNAQGAQIK